MTFRNDRTLVTFGNEVKALGNNTVGGYLVVFGSPDQTDLTPGRDYFTKDTDFDIAVGDKRTTYYAHGADKTLGLRKLGTLEIKDLSRDNFGVWAEAQLLVRDKYEEFVYKMAEAGKLGWSSGTPAHLVNRKSVGMAHEILHWPIGEGSLTPKPAEPRCGAYALKSLGDLLGIEKADPTTARLSLAPLDAPWDAHRAESRLMARKAASYTNGGDAQYEPMVTNRAGGTGDDVDGDGEPEPGMADWATVADGFVWGYTPGFETGDFGVFKLPVAELEPDGSLRIVSAAVKQAADLVHNYWDTLGIPNDDKPRVKAALDALFGELRGEYGDAAPIAPWESKQTNPPDGSGLTFEAQTNSALATLSGWHERASGLIALGTKEGKKLSAARQDRLRGVLDQLASTRTSIEEMLNEAAPPQVEGEGVGIEMLGEFMKHQKTLNDLRRSGFYSR